MLIAKSLLLFTLAAAAKIGRAWLVWQGVREHKGWIWIGAGVIALGLDGFVATLQPDANFGRILTTYGGVFVAGSLAGGWSPTASGPTATTSPERSSASSASPSSCTPHARLPDPGTTDKPTAATTGSRLCADVP